MRPNQNPNRKTELLEFVIAVLCLSVSVCLFIPAILLALMRGAGNFIADRLLRLYFYFIRLSGYPLGWLSKLNILNICKLSVADHPNKKYLTDRKCIICGLSAVQTLETYYQKQRHFCEQHKVSIDNLRLDGYKTADIETEIEIKKKYE